MDLSDEKWENTVAVLLHRGRLVTRQAALNQIREDRRAHRALLERCRPGIDVWERAECVGDGRPGRSRNRRSRCLVK